MAAVLYRNTLNDWFLPDETMIIAELAELDFVGAVTYGEYWGNFVPLLYVSLWFDWKLFGLDPTGYRIHSIAASVLVAALGFVLVRRWLPRGAAAAAGACVLLAPPTIAVTSWICTRHYLEGAVFAMLGAIVIARHLESPTKLKALLGGAMYFAACLGKEIFAVLPAALVFMPWSEPKPRLRGCGLESRLAELRAHPDVRARFWLATGLILGLFGYVCYRLLEVDVVFTKYGEGSSFVEKLHYFIVAWPEFSGWMASRGQTGTGFVIGVLLTNAMIVGTIAYWGFRRSANTLFFPALLLASCLPSIMVLDAPEVRFLQVANHFCLRFVYLPAIIVILWTFVTLGFITRKWLFAVSVPILIWFAVAGSSAVHPWSHSSRLSRGATDVYAKWWDRQAVLVSDHSHWLHKGLHRLWSLSDGPPKVSARVLSTRGAAGSLLSPDDPLLASPDTVYIEDLQWRRISRVLSRDEFIDRYVRRE
ncbi:MAG TPA: hypothetical protein VLB51_13710 [Methylomirabilota bacterium]|nr:hypothetical protein [Methylomirabilota bacterium]